RTLARFARRPRVESCDLCAAPLGDGHEHLVDPRTRRLACACIACATAIGTSECWKYVPPRAEIWRDCRLSDAHWAALGVPIGLAFFTRSSIEKRIVACYPSPAGVTESTPSLDAWNAIVDENPALAALVEDTEAWLARRLGGRGEHYRVSIDQCARLTGII